MLKLIEIVKSDKPDKKFKAVFNDDGKTITTYFGQAGFSDYTIHKNPLRKRLYLRRHIHNENWGDATSAGALSRYILWNLPDLDDSIRDYKKRFHL